MNKPKKADKKANGDAARPEILHLTAEESLKRMAAFKDRREAFIAAIRKNKD